MLGLADKQMLIQALGQVIYDEVQAAVKPLQEKIATLEKALAGKIDAEFVRNYVGGAMAGITIPPDTGGRDADRANGTGVCLDDIRPCVADLVAQAVRDLPVQPHHVAWFVDRAGALSATLSNGEVKVLGQVVGPPGKDCDMAAVQQQVAEFLEANKPKDGIDGLSIEQIEYDGERTFRLANGKVDRSFVIPFPLYRGLWKPGIYVRGDEVTSDGSQFIAMRDTDKAPGTVDSGWRMDCKRGAVGSQGRPGKDAGK